MDDNSRGPTFGLEKKKNDPIWSLGMGRDVDLKFRIKGNRLVDEVLIALGEIRMGPWAWAPTNLPCQVQTRCEE